MVVQDLCAKWSKGAKCQNGANGAKASWPKTPHPQLQAHLPITSERWNPFLCSGLQKGVCHEKKNPDRERILRFRTVLWATLQSFDLQIVAGVQKWTKSEKSELVVAEMPGDPDKRRSELFIKSRARHSWLEFLVTERGIALEQLGLTASGGGI